MIKKIEYIDGLFIRNYVYYNEFCKKNCKEVSHFSISVSISVYKYYKSLKVIDPCIGWGERLIGSLFSNIEGYWGFDPSLEMHERYKEMYKIIKEKKNKMENKDKYISNSVWRGKVYTKKLFWSNFYFAAIFWPRGI